MRKMLVSILLWASFCSGAIGQDQPATRGTPSSVAPPELLKFIETETSILGQFHLAPIIIPQGERVGDIIDVANATLIAGSDDCFPASDPDKIQVSFRQLLLLPRRSWRRLWEPPRARKPAEKLNRGGHFYSISKMSELNGSPFSS
jgi:hypothetical protein